MDNQDPHALSARLLALAQEYSTGSRELGILRKNRAMAWLEARKEAKTDKEATMRLEATTEGQRETELSYLLKGLEKELGAIKSHLRVLDIFGN